MLVIDNKYDIGQEIYLKTDKDQQERIITRIMVMGGNTILYELSCGVDSKWFHDFELSVDKNVLIQ